MVNHVRTILFVILFSAGSVNAGLAVSPGTPAHTHSDANTGGGTLAVSGTVSSTKACDAGYTRTGPNFCSHNGGLPTTALVLDACTSVTLPTGAKALLFDLTISAKAGNAIANRSTFVLGYDDAGCTNAKMVNEVTVREFVATAAGTALSVVQQQAIMAVPTGICRLKLAGGLENVGTASYSIFGYFD